MGCFSLLSCTLPYKQRKIFETLFKPMKLCCHDGGQALVGFGATAMTAAPTVALKQIFDGAGVVAARITGGLRPPLNATSHVSVEVCKDAVADNGHCWGRTDADVSANLRTWAEDTVAPYRNAGFKKLAQLSLHDELGWSYPSIWGGGANISGNPRLQKKFIRYIKANSGFTTPQAFGASSWDGVVPITFANVTKGHASEHGLRVPCPFGAQFTVCACMFVTKTR